MDEFVFESMVCPDGFGDTSYSREKIERLRGTLGEAGERFFNGVSREIERYNSHSFRENLRSYRNRVESYFAPDIVTRIADIDKLRTAPSRMRRYVMSEPIVRAKYYKGEAGGYDGDFEDRAVGEFEENDPTWCSVMSDVVVVKDDKAYSKTYLGDGIDRLTATERFDILETWETIRDLIEEGREDPTDMYGGKL